MPDPTNEELWLIGRVMEHLDVRTRSGARTFLRRAGIQTVDYVTGPTGRPEARYQADAVRDAAAMRPGRGARTDLNRDA
ncbi:hypothetical protein STBA_01190 [Streptomyces sp. MP131-18]|nr:hypothetical protein STBA_01190 [Streptomyces sp. MP131-18]